MKLYIKTFGCQMNVHDSERIRSIFEAAGYEMTSEPSESDVALINSCTIREKAWHKAISETGRLRKHKRSKHKKVIGIVGCVAQQEGEKIFELLPGVDLVVSPDNYANLVGFVEQVLNTGHPVSRNGFDDGNPKDFLSIHPLHAESEVSSFVTVMKGCEERCAYCIVPTVRGPERHRPVRDIVDEVSQLVSKGTREITLLGQKVNAYFEGGVTFADLLEELDGIISLSRLRFTSPHPRHMTSGITNSFGRLRTLCEAIHLPLQSGSDRVLELMRRRYTREDYLRVVNELRVACPGIAISTDLIVGFPGETEKDFLHTLDLIDKVSFCAAFSFKYSPRPGTPASELEDDVPPEEKSRRLLEVHNKINILEAGWRESMKGKVLEVLVENEGRNPGQLGGRARNNQIVNFLPGDGKTIEHLKGSLVDVMVTTAHPHSLEGEQVV